MTLPQDTSAWPDEAKEELEERIAIMIFHGGLPEYVARVEAEERVRARRKA